MLHGSIVGREPHPSMDGYDVVQLQLDVAEAVAGLPNLFRPVVGTTINVTAPRALLKSATIGDGLRCIAKRTPDGGICPSGIQQGSFTVTPGRS